MYLGEEVSPKAILKDCEIFFSQICLTLLIKIKEFGKLPIYRNVK
jgi:hypothetical protein